MIDDVAEGFKVVRESISSSLVFWPVLKYTSTDTAPQELTLDNGSKKDMRYVNP